MREMVRAEGWILNDDHTVAIFLEDLIHALPTRAVHKSSVDKNSRSSEATMPLAKEYATIVVELAGVLTSASYDTAQFRLEQALAHLVRTPDTPSIAAFFGGVTV